MTDEKDGVYCKVCGGIVSEEKNISMIEVDGKPTGINQLEFILDEVAALHLQSDSEISAELIKRAKIFNYIPSKVSLKYAEALLCVYHEHMK